MKNLNLIKKVIRRADNLGLSARLSFKTRRDAEIEEFSVAELNLLMRLKDEDFRIYLTDKIKQTA